MSLCFQVILIRLVIYVCKYILTFIWFFFVINHSILITVLKVLCVKIEGPYFKVML